MLDSCSRYQIGDVFLIKYRYKKLFIYLIIKDSTNQYVIVCSRSNVRLFWNTSSEEHNYNLQAIDLYINIIV